MGELDIGIFLGRPLDSELSYVSLTSERFHVAGPAAWKEKIEQADFVMLRDGKIVFEGSADELRASDGPYLKAFLS